MRGGIAVFAAMVFIDFSGNFANMPSPIYMVAENCAFSINMERAGRAMALTYNRMVRIVRIPLSNIRN